MTDIDGGPDREWLLEFRQAQADFATESATGWISVPLIPELEMEAG